MAGINYSEPVFSGQGGVIHSSAPNGQVIGEVFISEGFLIYDDPDNDIYFEYEFELCCPVLGGYENSVLYLRPESFDAPLFYLDDLSYLDKLVEIAPPNYRHQYQALQNKKRSGGLFSCCLSFFFGIGSFIVIILGSF